MGLFADIKNSFYLASCVKQVKAVSPANERYAYAFCEENSKELLRGRDQGLSLDSSVGVLCMMMLDSPEKKMNSSDGLGGISLVVASNYAMSSIARWPHSGISERYEEALINFQHYINKHPITKDLDYLKELRTG